jgi:hypothetical protein
MELVERWFAELTNRKLCRSAHRSVTELEADIRKWISEWTKTADPGRRLTRPRGPPGGWAVWIS